MTLSVRTRMVLTVVAMIVVIVVVTLVVAYHEMQEAMYYAIDQIVLRDADLVQAELADSSGGTDAHELAEITESLSNRDDIQSPLYRIWIDGHAEDLLASVATTSPQYQLLTNVPIPSPSYPGDRDVLTMEAGGRTYRALALTVAVPGERPPINAVIAVPCDYALAEIREFRQFMLIFGGVLIVIAGTLAALLVRDIMRPIGRVADRLRQVTQENLDESVLEEASVPSDLRPFVEAVHTMLERLGKAFEMERRFTADAAHELRSPLAVAKSTVQASLALPEKKRDSTAMAESVLEDLNRMEQLIQQLLQLSRFDARPSSEMDVCNVQALLRDAVDPFQERQDDVCIVLKEPESPIDVRAHRDDLLRLLTNLLDNALRHGPKGGTVTVTASLEGDRQVRISVHDEGGQISPETIGHLTERFYRVDASRTRATGGTGLGLAIAEAIAQQHGSSLDVRSTPEEGTSVSLALETL